MCSEHWNKKVRVRAAMESVLADADLVSVVLAGSIGPSAFAAASCVCKTWLTVCRTDKRVLRGAAQYQGGLTKSTLMKLFAISSQVADALPRSAHKRFGGGVYYIYQIDAVDTLLANKGMDEWRSRLHHRGRRPCIALWATQPGCLRRTFEQEERLHAQASQRQKWRALRLK